jgi:hypothetical protein
MKHILKLALVVALFAGILSAAQAQEVAGVYVVSVSQANVRAEATTNARVVTRINRGGEVQVLRAQNGQRVRGSRTWYYVQIGTTFGYIHSSLVTRKAVQPLVVATPAPVVGNNPAPTAIMPVSGQWRVSGVNLSFTGDCGDTDTIRAFVAGITSVSLRSDGATVTVSTLFGGGTASGGNGFYSVDNQSQFVPLLGVTVTVSAQVTFSSNTQASGGVTVSAEGCTVQTPFSASAA